MPFCFNRRLGCLKQKKCFWRIHHDIQHNRIMLKFVESKKKLKYTKICSFLHSFLCYNSHIITLCETQKFHLTCKEKSSWHSPQNMSSSLTQHTLGGYTAGPGSATSLPWIWTQITLLYITTTIWAVKKNDGKTLILRIRYLWNKCYNQSWSSIAAVFNPGYAYSRSYAKTS